MTDDASPPPPPPLSPPPEPETTTIGKYIARFRYEKPQPRESRVSPQRGEFWWTKSPRFARSPSPPSTWASGGAFSFPDDELAAGSPQKEENASPAPSAAEGDDDESVDSVESKLRRRLGVWESDASRGIGAKSEEFGSEKVEDVGQSWGSADWSSVDLQEMDDELQEEDPEQVIERVRRRLGWGGASGVTLETAPRLKPLELHLSTDEEADRKQASRRTSFTLKPPLSPDSFRCGSPLDSGGCRSEASWGSLGHERRHADEGFDEVVSSMSSAGAKSVREQVSMVERTYEEKQPAVDGSEEKPAAQTARSVDEGDSTGVRGAPSPVDVAMRASHSSVDWPRSQGSELSDGPTRSLDRSTVAMDDALAADREESGLLDSVAFASERKEEVEEKDGEPKEQREPPENDTVLQAPGLPLLQTSSPARPDLVVGRVCSDALPGRSHESNSSLRRSEDVIPSQTTQTLDSLVSLVVHSWENAFFAGPEAAAVEPDEVAASEQNPTAAANASTSQEESASDDGNEDKGARDPSAQDPKTAVPVEGEEARASAPMPTENTPYAHDASEKRDSSLPVVREPVGNSTTQSDHEDEEKEDSPAPGEEDDQVVRMLLERVALLEEALRQTDT